MYRERYRTVCGLIPDGVRLVDYCCGDAEIYTSHLKDRKIDYLGLDFNDRFVSVLRKRGVPCLKLDILMSDAIVADYSLMMGSLYQFIPRHKELVDKILMRAKRFVISEPVRNNTESQHWLIRKLAYSLNDPGDGTKRYRFTEESFRDFLANYEDRIVTVVPGEIEMTVVLRGDLGGET